MQIKCAGRRPPVRPACGKNVGFPKTLRLHDASCYYFVLTQTHVQDCQRTMRMEMRSQRRMATQIWSLSLMFKQHSVSKDTLAA